jgi:RNA polymerase sigma-70 factor (ECF subfamily)
MDYQVLSTEELVRECAERPTNEAWAEFRKRFNRLIAGVVIKCCFEWNDTSQSTIEDLIQETYVKLCDNDYFVLKRFTSQHPGSFLGYLKVVTANVALDHFRAEHADKRNVENTVELNEAVTQLHGKHGNPELVELTIFFDQVDGLLRQRGNGPTEEKERSIFWLYYRQGLTSKAIASIPATKLSVKGVESVIFRLTSFIRKSLGQGPQAAGV